MRIEDWSKTEKPVSWHQVDIPDRPICPQTLWDLAVDVTFPKAKAAEGSWTRRQDKDPFPVVQLEAELPHTSMVSWVRAMCPFGQEST